MAMPLTAIWFLLILHQLGSGKIEQDIWERPVLL